MKAILSNTFLWDVFVTAELLCPKDFQWVINNANNVVVVVVD